MTRRRLRLLIFLALLLGAAAAVYTAAPSLLAAFITYRLGNDIGMEALEIESVGPGRTRVSVVRVNNKQMRFQAQQAVIRYRLWPFEIQGVEVGQAQLNVENPSAGDGTGGGLPVLPSFPLRVDRFTLQATTPWGAVSTPAVSLTSQTGGAGGLRASLRSERFELSLSNPATSRHTFELRDGSDDELLSVTVETGGGFPARAEGWIETGALTGWLPRSGLLPERLAAALEPYEVDETRVDFNAQVGEGGGFTLELEGEIGVHDRRAPQDERLFQVVRFEAEPGYTISRQETGWSGTGGAAFQVSTGTGTTLSGRDPSWHWDGGMLSLNARAVKLTELGVGAAAVEVSTPALTADDPEGALAINGVTANWWPDALDRYDVSGRWTRRDGSFHAAGSASGNALPALDWTVDTRDEGGSAEVTTDTPVASLASTLEVYTRSVARELEILGGDLTGRFRLDWTDGGQRSTLRLTADAVDANLDEMEVRGLSADLTNSGTGLEQLDLVVSAPTLKLAAGAVAENLALDLKLAPPVLHVDRARMNLFQGAIAVRPDSFNLNDDRFELFADITGLSLERVMSLLELETTELTGDVAGPVRVVYRKGRGIELNEGDLHSVEPGVLRFRVDSSSDMSSQFDNIALRALQNFQYDELNASLLYKPDGQYRIAARIVGRNPEVLDGHPIALNPTIEGRLPELFRAFFITGDFSRAIIERLRKEQSPSSSGETSTFEQD